jgi:ribosomal protein L37AE/L43A
MSDQMLDPAERKSTAPPTCPFCTSADVKTASKVINVSTYWRCATCGEIWNAGRLPPPRLRPGYRW